VIQIKLDRSQNSPDTKMMRRRPLREAVLSIFFRTLASLSRIVNIIFIPRYLSREFYGLYGFYMSRFVTILTSLQYVAKFWTYREESYGMKVVKAGLKASAITSVISYVISLFVLTFVYNVPMGLSMLISVLGSLYVIYDYLTVIPNVYKPHVTQLSFLILRAGQATLIVGLVLFKILNIETLLECVILCYIISIVFLFIHFKDIIKQEGERLLSCLRRWLRKFYVPTVESIAGLIYGLDALYITYIIGFNYVSGFFLALSIVYNIYSICGAASQGLTSYLLMTRDIERGRIYTYVTLIAAVPSYIFLFLYPWYVIALYGHKYVAYMKTLEIMSIYGCLTTLLGLLISLGSGVDVRDVETSSFRELKDTVVFRTRFVRLIVAIIYTPAIIVTAWYLHALALSPITIIEVWSLAMIIRALAENIAQYLYAIRRAVSPRDLWRTILRPLTIATISGVVSAILLNWYERSVNISQIFNMRLIYLLPLICEKYLAFIVLSTLISVLIDRDLRNIARMIILRATRRIS